LKEYWGQCPNLKKSLFKECRPKYSDLKVSKTDIKKSIFDHPEFTVFVEGMSKHFDVWKNRNIKTLRNLKLSGLR